ncbi:methyltransferase [Halovenus sp. WSH3]|uniref:Methyltransferase n=1 Tax=Halovenus carboxidivorans TaxID=2692199 RepID=A0A6B0TBG8_9EURY|nr:class I SAM-dependent methyltransferase [Halovenus carboxidivorans]MXR52250.1 methyltransferase [Halovenus carboxidivorans]
MDDTQRSQVLDNAKYLREVRPIDPEEIHEYVRGQPHPAAVRQVLRESALELGLVEREDGRFEPASTDPVDLSFDGVDSLPSEIALSVEELLLDAFGPGWPDGTSGDRLRATIRDFKRQYLSGGEVTYDEVTALGYAIYHLPTYFAATQYVLADLAADGLLSGELRVLDVGAGVGGPALGLSELLPDDTLIEYHAVEPSDAADVLEDLLDTTGRNFHPAIHRERVETAPYDGEFDLILCANVLSELDDPESVVEDLLDHLAADGTLCAIAPADRNTAIRLREIERTAEREAGATIYAPTVRLWPHERPESTSWSFDRRPDLDVPAFQRRLDEGERTPEFDDPDSDREPGDGEFVNVDVQYACSLLRTDGRRRLDIDLSGGRFAKMAETERHVTDRIDCAGVKLSTDLADGGNPLFLIGDGSQKIDHFAVLTEESLLNEDLRRADYGEFLQIENVLVLWNDDEGAYNLVVDGETVVERLPA